MIVLLDDDGWTLASAAWSLGSDPANADRTFLSYMWGQKGTSQVWSVTVHKPVSEILDLLAQHAAEGILDLRPFQQPPA